MRLGVEQPIAAGDADVTDAAPVLGDFLSLCRKGIRRIAQRPRRVDEWHAQRQGQPVRRHVAHADVEQVLMIPNVVLQSLALRLFYRAAVVVSRDEVPAGDADLPVAALLICRAVRAKHGRVASNEHSTLRPRLARRDEDQTDGDGREKRPFATDVHTAGGV
jgi:hypothetical protein